MRIARRFTALLLPRTLLMQRSLLLGQTARRTVGHGIAVVAADFSFSSYGKGRTPSIPLEVGPLNTAIGVCGERYKLPQWGLGRSSSRQTI